MSRYVCDMPTFSVPRARGLYMLLCTVCTGRPAEYRFQKCVVTQTAMEVYPNNHPLLIRFRKTRNIQYGVNDNHVCSPACTYYESAVRTTFICVASLKVHACTDKCTLSEAVDGVQICPISGIEKSGHAEVYYADRTSGGGGPDRFVSTITWQNGRRNLPKKTAKPPKTVCHGKYVKKYVEELLVRTSPFNDIIASTGRRSKNLARTFQENITPLVHALHQHCKLLELPPITLCTDIARYISRVRELLDPLPPVSTMVAVVFSLLAEGLTLGDVVVFPRVPWVAERSPPLVAYAKLEGLQCRGMSVCTRRLKTAMCANNPNGAISPEFVFASSQ